MNTHNLTIDQDNQFGDQLLDFSVGDKRIVRATVKSYPTTGVYVFIKLFKKNNEGTFTRMQQIGLTQSEFHALMDLQGKLLPIPEERNQDTQRTPVAVSDNRQREIPAPVETQRTPLPENRRRYSESTPPKAPAKRRCTTTPVGGNDCNPLFNVSPTIFNDFIGQEGQTRPWDEITTPMSGGGLNQQGSQQQQQCSWPASVYSFVRARSTSLLTLSFANRPDGPTRETPLFSHRH